VVAAAALAAAGWLFHVLVDPTACQNAPLDQTTGSCSTLGTVANAAIAGGVLWLLLAGARWIWRQRRESGAPGDKAVPVGQSLAFAARGVIAGWLLVTVVLILDGGPCGGSRGCTTGASLLFVTWQLANLLLLVTVVGFAARIFSRRRRLGRRRPGMDRA
jgi:hypothetical protein